MVVDISIYDRLKPRFNSTAVSQETKILALTFTGSILLAAIYLYAQDLLYIKVTGRPASEREGDRLARKYRPLTRPRYVASFVFLILATLPSAYSAGGSGDYQGWSKLYPLAWMISGAYLLYYLRKRWRKQQSDLRDQLSGEAR